MRDAEAGGLTSEQLDAVDRFCAREATRIAAAVRDLPWAGGLAAREAIAPAVEEERSKGGFLTKETFDDVLQWGFGQRSRLGEEEYAAPWVAGDPLAPADFLREEHSV